MIPDQDPIPYNISNTAEIGLALAAIEARLMKVINQAVARMTQIVNETLVAQAQAHATFATGVQVEALRTELSATKESLAALTERVSSQEKQLVETRTSQATGAGQITNWAVMALITFGAALFAFYLAHSTGIVR